MSATETAPDRPNPRSPDVWRIRGRDLPIDRPIVVGILNVTPDSFSDGGQFESTDAALAQAERMLAEGADAVDIGGESTRPQGARPVSAAEEMARILPTIRAVRGRFASLLISVDTTKSEVASAAIAEGADIMNDVSGFRIDPRMGEIAAVTGAGVVLMHSRGSVEEMGTYRHANYDDDVVAVVRAELGVLLASALEAGVNRQAIVLDPGIGFAKRSDHSLLVLARLERLTSLGCAIMVGVSRKRFIGELSGVSTARDRVAGTVGANVAALMHGARLFRVHDVAANRQALDVAWGVIKAGRAVQTPGDSQSPSSRFPVPGSRRP
ncbi:MAG TPA: dihydropteroate synthase [Gemmatimonadaceae bacterium]|nr:dihydropteroate synthase [Gemmatimonadaceae bacterium]